MMSDKLKEVLKDRGEQYGPFANHATIVQNLKNYLIMVSGERWLKYPADAREALEMIVHKIGRLVNGNINNEDSWRDIAGYSTLVADRILGESTPRASLSRSEILRSESSTPHNNDKSTVPDDITNTENDDSKVYCPPKVKRDSFVVSDREENS